MNIWQFASESPYLTFFLALLIVHFFRIILIYCIKMPLRAVNIRKHGWPPPHCDADGDFRVEKK